MKDYRLFEITDFVMDEDFIRWVFENKTIDRDFWNQWLGQNPDKLLIVAEARQVLESLKIEQGGVSEQQIETDVERLMQTIQMQPGHQKKDHRVLSFSRVWWYAAAASVAVITTLGAYYFLNTNAKNVQADPHKYVSQVSAKHLIENINTSSKSATITLPDGSIVKLAPESRISYANSFDSTGTRDIYLSGEAFFDVVKNPNQPFRVFSNEIITKVLGTIFTVKSFDKDSIIQIIVTSGKVSVYSQTGNTNSKNLSSNKLGGILLTANQQLVYEKIPQTFQKIIAESPSIILPDIMDQRIPYEDVPLEEVFRQLSRAYGIDIVYDSEVLKDCTVTADIRHESFYRQLDLVCEAVGARYELMDGQVVIQSKGCQ
jgi:transmembrane sensor